MDETQAFEEIKKKILLERSLDVNQYKENYLKRRLAVRMRALRISKYSDYALYLDRNNSEYNTLFDKLTINVTQFFRDPEVFVELENEILPEIFKKAKKLNVWSAGCSSGEEPYSIAISIEESKEKHGCTDIDYEISATDLDDVSLYRAIAGKYEGRTLENIARARKEKYFTGSRFYTVNDSVKSHVKFVKMNMMEPYKQDCFDLVFCRNVIIYFAKDLQKTVMKYFYDSMKNGAVLFLGKTETMLSDFRDRFECVNIKERIFKKI